MILFSFIHECEEIMKKESASFYAAFSNLPSPRREAVYVIYAFCRMIDDAVDEPDHSPYTLQELTQLFDSLETAEGHFIWPALKWLFSEFPITKEPFYKQMSGQMSDLTFTSYDTVDQLEKYCAKVAGSVGEMLLPVLHDAPSPMIAQSGIYLGNAMQIVNIIRDVGEDYERGRRYLPTELMDRFGYSNVEYEQRMVTDSFKQLLNYMMELASQWFEKGMQYLDTYPESSAFSIRLAAGYYAAIMDEVIEEKYQVFTKRAVVSDSKKMEIYLRAYYKYKILPIVDKNEERLSRAE